MAPIVILLFALAVSAVHGLGDPCDPSVYKELSNIYRSTGFKTDFPEEPLCDDQLKPGWYRFHSDAGDQMPESCPDRKSCGTIVPVWMNGAHPTVGEDIVTRAACAHFDSGEAGGTSCCRHTVEMGVKNCSGFYVYLLKPTPSCPMAYCAGSRAPCPVGQWSPTGFPPNCQPAYPMITTAPVLDGPIIEDRRFYFSCKIHYSHGHGPDGDPAFEVAWTFDGNDTNTVPVTTLRGNNRTAVLEGHYLAGHLGTHVGCKVRSFFEAVPSRKSPWVDSNTYWAGIRTEPTHLTISQAVEEKNVTLTSTIPMVCDHDFECCIMIKLDIDGPSNKLVTPHQCKRAMCEEDWGSVTAGAIVLTIPLIASKDQIQDGTSDLLLGFEELINAGGGPYMEPFAGYQVQPVQIEVEKEPSETCTLVTDPHITSIDSDRTFNLYRVGDYTAYERPDRHFEVQIRTWPCNGGRVTCICGVAIREKDDLIRIHGCDRAYYSRSLGAPDIEVVRPLREGTSVMQSTDGHEIAVYLPSGSEVIVRAYSNYGGHFNVHLAIPSSDKGKKGAAGLCGTYDGDRTNDFTYRDGVTVDRSCNSYCTPEAFTESWKNDRTTSLFRIVPAEVKEEYNTKYCQCQTGVSTPINCTARGDVAQPVMPCIGACVIRTFPWMTGVWQTKRRRAADETVYVDVDEPETPAFDPDDYANFRPAALSWPTPSGITEQEAARRCGEALRQSQLWSHCQGQAEQATNSIDNCKEDVLFADSFDSVQSLIESFTSDCQAELSKDPANYVTNTEGEVVIKPELSTELCSVLCLEHGTCQNGQCVCNANYTGENCQLLAGVGPQLLGIRGSEFCDINTRPCRKVFLNVTNIQMTDKLTCKVQEILPSGDVSPNIAYEDAEFISGIKMMCSLPDARVKSDRSVKKFMISASMDGTLFGNALNLTVYDSICRDCSDSGCVHVDGTCLINELCYSDGDLNPSNQGKMCRTANSMPEWTNLYPEMSPPVLAGPDSQGAITCSVQTNETSSTARYKVSWYVNGQPYPRERELGLTPGSLVAAYSVQDFPKTGTLVCKMSSYYTDEDIPSPKLTSNTLDLSTITSP